MDSSWRPWSPLLAGVSRTVAHLDAPSLVVASMKRSPAGELDIGSIAEPLEILTRSLDRQANLHGPGRLGARRQLIASLVRRGLLASRQSSEPPIGAGDHGPAIVIAGLPGAGSVALRRWLTLDAIWHPVEDETELFAAALATMDYEVQWHVPAFAEWFDAADLSEPYRFVSGVLSRRRPVPLGTRWVLCSPQHLERLDELSVGFPGATVVRLHEDHDRALARATALVVGRRRQASRAVDPEAIRRYCAWRIDRALARSQRWADRSDLSVLDVSRDELRADPGSVVERIYAAAGHDQTGESHDALRRSLRREP